MPRIIANTYADSCYEEYEETDLTDDDDMLGAVLDGELGVDVVYLLKCDDDGAIAESFEFSKDDIDELVGRLFEFSISGYSVFQIYCMDEGCISLEIRLVQTDDLTTNISADSIEDVSRVLKYPVYS